jgi:hypothetical protein
MAPASPDDAVLSRSTLMTVRRVLHAYREGWLLEARLAAAARMIAEDARQRDVPAERMLVALKREWGALEEVRRMSPLDARELLDQLVTLGVRAYYDAAQPRRLAAAPAVSRPGGARTAA